MAKEKIVLNLQYFDGAAGSAAGSTGAGAEGAGPGENGAVANAQESYDAGKKRGRVNPLKDVRYGIQDEDEAHEDENSEAEDSDKGQDDHTESFDDLIKGRFKDEFDKRVQKIISQRFKDLKQLQGDRDSYQQIMTMLADKYGKDAGDVKGVYDALSNDSSIWEERAMEKGMTTDQYKELSRIMSENRQLKERQQREEQQRRANEILGGWRQEAESLKSTYPAINFDTEMQNQNVVKLLQNGIPFKTAYEVAHKDEIMQGTIAYAVQRTAENVTNNIRSRAQRPSENGMRNHASGNVKSDVSKLTKADRLEIARRAADGVKIRF